MIEVDIELYENGCLNAFRARGHSGCGPAGRNLVCASATALLKTAAKVLYSEKTLRAAGDADSPGHMNLTVREIPQARANWVRGVTDFLVGGLIDLQRDYPGELTVRIHGMRGQ